ncbi:MAG: YggT family protein [Nitrospirota bacterium]
MDKYQIIAYTINFLVILGNLVTYAIIGRVLVSWFTMGRPGAGGPVSRFLIEVTDPVIRLAQKLPHKIGMIDLSPIIALIGVDLIIRLLVISLNKLVML